MTTTPELPAPIPGVDEHLAGVCEDHGQYLAGLIAAGMLEHAGVPAKLPELLCPDDDPEVVRRIWQAALPIGVNLGRYLYQPRSTREGFNRLRAALADASYKSMARLAHRTANTTAPAPHPADHDTDTARGEHR